MCQAPKNIFQQSRIIITK